MAETFDLLDPTVIARLQAQPLLSRFPMEGSVSGHHKSPHRGSSVEFAEYRNYVPGDDTRRLDWRVFARTDRFYLKEFEAETNLRCYLVIDASASMAFSGKGPEKLGMAWRMAAALAYLVIHQGDAAGIFVAGGGKIHELPPRRNPAHLSDILKTMSEVRAKGETNLIPALHELASKIRRRALVVVVSDLFCDPQGFLDCCQHLRFQKHDVAVFHLLDPEEVEFTFDRPIRFLDLESSYAQVCEPAMIRDEYLKAIHRYLELVKGGCMEFNIDYRRVLTHEGYEAPLAQFLVDRAQIASAATAIH